MPDAPHTPERRKDDSLTGYRLDRMESEQEKTNKVLNDLDAKLDALRADLFERAVFVNLTTLQLELQSRDNKILNLQRDLELVVEKDDKDVNLHWVKMGIGASLFVGIMGCAVGIIGLIIRGLG